MSAVSKEPFPKKDFIHPRYWSTWLMLGFLWFSAQLPYKWQMRLGALLGYSMGKTMGLRRHFAEINIDLCFPELIEKVLL